MILKIWSFKNAFFLFESNSLDLIPNWLNFNFLFNRIFYNESHRTKIVIFSTLKNFAKPKKNIWKKMPKVVQNCYKKAYLKNSTSTEFIEIRKKIDRWPPIYRYNPCFFFDDFVTKNYSENNGFDGMFFSRFGKKVKTLLLFVSPIVAFVAVIVDCCHQFSISHNWISITTSFHNKHRTVSSFYHDKTK